LPAPPREIERALDLARRHGPHIAGRIVGTNQRVDGFGDFEAGAVADGAASTSRMPPSTVSFWTKGPIPLGSVSRKIAARSSRNRPR
jgi:hypothetical protein